MADLELQSVKQELRRRRSHPGHRPRDREGRIRGLRRALGLRQVHAPADDRRPRGCELGHDPDRRPRRDPGRAVGARHRDGVPVLRALPAHDGRREHRLRPEPRATAEGRDRRGGRQGGPHPATRAAARPQAQGALWRPAPARRDRSGHRSQSQGLPVRRAAVEPRRGAALADAAGAHRPAPARSARR